MSVFHGASPRRLEQPCLTGESTLHRLMLHFYCNGRAALLQHYAPTLFSREDLALTSNSGKSSGNLVFDLDSYSSLHSH